jgi:protein-disulfide isomerase
MMHRRRAAHPLLVGFLLLAAILLFPITPATAQKSPGAIAVEPVSLPDMALGSRNAPITIVDYSSMTCSHCAQFEQNVLPAMKAKYIDTGYVRFVFREYPLDVTAVAASMLARCIANDDADRYFRAIDSLFRQQEQLIKDTLSTLDRVGAQFGMNDRQVEICLKDQPLLDRLTADQEIGSSMVKIESTPTFFVNGRAYKGYMPFDDWDGIIRSQPR